MPERAGHGRFHNSSLRGRTCCARGAVNVTGADIVRISRTLALEPWHFTQAVRASADDPAGIVLDHGRRRVALTLANAAHGCVFRLRTPSGEGRCGLGELAPVSCRVFPFDPASNVPGEEPGIGEEAGGDTEEAPVPPADLAELMLTWAADHAHWHGVVARWNAHAAESGVAAEPCDLEDFHRYLLQAQSEGEVRP